MTEQLPATLKYDEILDPSIERPCQVILDKSAFLSASAKGKTGACGVLLSPEKISNGQYVQEKVHKFAALLSVPESELEWKIISSDINVSVIVDSIRARQGTIVKEVSKNGTTDIWFWPASAKLRISKSLSSKVRVLIVDDSKTIRDLLLKILKADAEVEVVGLAEDPRLVEDLIKKTKPDVMTLDVHMPGMSGVELLRKIFPIYRIPTIMITSLSMDDGPDVLNALELGAIDYIKKPEFKELVEMAPLIREKIKMAARANLQERKNSGTVTINNVELDQSKLIVIGSSTGGTEALKDILTKLPANIPPILIVQHIPPVFSAAFASRLNDLCPFQVREAADGDLVTPGLVLIAPGGTQMLVVEEKGQFKIRVTDDPPCNRHKPSVDILFDSVPRTAASKTLGIILTGMGADGAKGLLALKNNGAQTIAQDEESCVVFGMPREAIKCGGAQHVVSLGNIASKIVTLISKRRTAA